MTSKTLGSALALALLASIFFHSTVPVALGSIFTDMTVVGWLFILGGDHLSRWLNLPESKSLYVEQLKEQLIAGLGWLLLLLVAGVEVGNALAR